MRRLLLMLHLPLLITVKFCSAAETVERDILRRWEMDPDDRRAVPAFASNRERDLLMLEVLADVPEARTVFYYRLRGGTLLERRARLILEFVYAGQVGVEIRCPSIGPGFVLGHGQASVIWAARIGQDCTIFQHCSIGLKAGATPAIGDRVWIWPGGKVLGANLGDDCTVGAGAVVTRDVPAGRTAVGIPATLLPAA